MATDGSGAHIVDIYASILKPLKPGGDYLVIVSAFSADPTHALIAHPYKARNAASMAEAAAVLAKLSAELQSEMELGGYQVRLVKRSSPR